MVLVFRDSQGILIYHKGALFLDVYLPCPLVLSLAARVPYALALKLVVTCPIILPLAVFLNSWDICKMQDARCKNL